MNEERENGSETEKSPVLTQAQLYDDLRRIGQLEDQKYAIQVEIDQKTERLRAAIPHLEKDSLLCRMLTAALSSKAPPKKTPATGGPARKKTTSNTKR